MIIADKHSPGTVKLREGPLIVLPGLLLDMTIITRWPEPAANNVPLETVQVHL